MKNTIYSKASKIKQKNIPFSLNEKEFYLFIQRLTNKVYADSFKIKKIDSLDGYDSYKLFDEDNKIVIEATSGSAAGVAFNRYLKEKCHYYIGFLTSNGTLPEVPPKVNEVIEHHSIFHYRYFLNYCTFGYTFAYYDWKDYERVIDRMILSGYNLVLNPIGQETIWYEALIKLGYSQQDAKNFLVDIAFMPWFNMMNITTYLANYTDKEFKRRIQIANKFSKRLQAFGAGIMLPGYAGMVPNDFKNYFPNANLIDQGLWCGYERQDYLRFDDPLFEKVADTFYQTQDKLLGHHKAHYYSTDPFHEGGISDGIDLDVYSKEIFRIMKKNDSKAVWSLQGWESNPKREIISAIPAERILVCNLLSDTNIADDFNHRPWIFGSVNNFGGNRLLRCGYEKTLTRTFECVKDKNLTCVGVGLLPEAIESDEIIFDIIGEISVLEKAPNIEEFTKDYIQYRYGTCNESLYEAWKILADKVYVKDQISEEIESIIAYGPCEVMPENSFHAKKAFGFYPQACVDVAKLLLSNYEDCKESSSYKFDLIDIMRQAASDYGWHIKRVMEDAFANKKYNKYCKASSLLIKLLKLLDDLCSCHPNSLYSTFIEYPTKYSKNKQEKEHNIYCNKKLITNWGDERSKGCLNDYANRAYGGLIKNYYLKRWEKFINLQKESLRNNTPFVNFDMYQFAEEFNLSKKKIKCTLRNDLDSICKQILEIVEVKY